MGDKEDYLTSYRVFFENFAATVNPEDQLPVYAPDYSITEAELPGDVIYWSIEYLREKSCPGTLMTPLLRIILDEVRVAAKKHPNEFGFDSDSSAYRGIWLMQAVIARVNDVCLRYLDNSKLDTLPPPPPLEQKEFRTVSAALRNSRRAMEDRHVEIGNLEALFDIDTTEHTSFYAVYDGHAGSSAAQYCAAHLHQYLVESPNFKTNIRNALQDAFLKTDAEFIRKSKNEHRVVGGSTAVVVCVRGKRLMVAWAGDSLALVAQRMRVMQLVHPHNPSREDERERIEALGGIVTYWGTWRVNGQLAVSRAIGDAQYKPYVIARPEVVALDLDGDEDFLVVACDGLWDVVSEDEVALAVYRQIADDPNDLKAVTKRLIGLAKRKGSEDNISIIVVFLKDPRDIAAQNCPPMDLGLDNAVVNAPPFSIDGDACKITGSIAEAAGGDCANDNGVSDSDSEDLGPETAVDIDADDGDVEMRNHEPAPPTPPAHSVEESHIDGNLVDNVAESGEESEDEWNYYKGEGEPEQNPSEEIDEPPHSETPCQDNSAWESSSVDMNSSPLNPDAPVFVPGGVAGSDILLAESPRKPQPMEDIVVPDADQFKTELGGRPSEMQDLDNCDQLNGHHNISIDGITAHLNGNNKCDMDSFEFGVGIDSDKIKDSSIIHDFERIQKDTTDFCNIQVFQTHTETNPFDIDGNNDLLERLKNKERDPMSMSFYQEKDDDTCERFTKLDSQVDLNSLQPLPDSEDDDDIEANGDCQDEDKENVSPVCQSDLFSTNDNTEEPNNDIIRFDDRNDFIENNYAEENITNCNLETSNMQNDAIPEFECNINQESIVPTDTPESHKLLFEQIPEIPDGKSSELGFSNDEILDPTEREKDDRAITPQENIAQEQESEIKVEESEGFNPDLTSGMSEPIESTIIEHEDLIENDTEPLANIPSSEEHLITPEIDLAQPDIFEQQIESNIIVDVHQSEKEINDDETFSEGVIDGFALSASPAASPLPTTSPLPTESSVLDEVKPPMPAEVPLPRESPAPSESPILEDNVGQESTLSVEEPECDKLQPVEESYQPKSPLPDEHIQRDSPITDDLLDTKPYESTVESEVVEDLIPEQQSPAPVDEAVYKEDIQVLEPVFKEEIQVAEPVLKEEIQVAEPVFKEDIHIEEPVLKENVHVDEIIESELPISENSVVSDSPIFVDKFERIENPIEPTIIYEATPNVQESIAAESPIPEETVVVKSPLPVEENDTQMIESKLSKEPSQLSPFPVNNVQNEMPVESQEFEKLIDPVPATETEISMDCNVPHEPIIEHRYLLSESAPAPDIVSEHARSELVTDIDIGIPESRAQEICVPVTNEIQNHAEEIPPATTPPPTPAVDLTEPPLSDVPIAAVAAATAAGAAVAAALAAKPKTSPVKKAPATSTTPTPRPKTVAKTPTPAKTPMSTTKRPTSTTTTPRTAATKPAAPKTPVSATAKTSKPAPKPASPTKAAPKPPAPVKEGPVTKAAPARTTSAPRPATKPAAPKPPAAKSTTSTAARPTTTAAPRVPAAKPTTRPVTAKTTAAPAKPPVAKTTTPATTKTVAAPKPKAPEKKPLMNGDAKPPAKPAPKAPAPAARPAPRLAPRPPVSAPAKTAPAKPPVRAPLDKQSKDLANKRITAKTAPPRTATAKSSVASKTAVKSVPKKSDSNKKEIIANGLNGSAELTKPSSPPVDNALLPDVIA